MNFFWAKIRGAKTILAVKKGGHTLFFGDKMGGRNFFTKVKFYKNPARVPNKILTGPL